MIYVTNNLKRIQNKNSKKNSKPSADFNFIIFFKFLSILLLGEKILTFLEKSKHFQF